MLTAKIEDEIQAVARRLGMSGVNAAFAGKCRVIDSFKITDRIGEGTYGTVYKAIDLRTDKVVALKRVKMEKVSSAEGFPMTIMREITLLNRLKHPNIVELQDVVVGSTRDRLFLAFEYCEHDMANLLDHMRGKFAESEVKCLLHQLLLALSYMHENWVMHRDLKLSNMLFNNEGVLKLADFGLARTFSSPPVPYTPNVVTLWYRAPELLLGDASYTTGLDMWAVGCIFAELWLHTPLMPGKTELQQLDMICRLLGTPNTRIWPDFANLPDASKIKMQNYPYSKLKAVVPTLNDEGFDLLSSLLRYDPKRRISARDALRHPYFTKVPLPKAVHLMPTFPAFNLTPVKRAEPSSSTTPKKKQKGLERSHQ